eukprot:c23006_g2_i1 orf=2-2161(-)
MRKVSLGPHGPKSVSRYWDFLTLEEALLCLDQKDVSPCADDIICILQKCRISKHLLHAKCAHAHIRRLGLEAHGAIGNHLVPTFVECGSLSDAQEVFSRLVHKNVHAWTSLMLGYVKSENAQHALDLYQKMQEERVQPSAHTLVAALKACTELKGVHHGQLIHGEIAQLGFEGDLFVGSSLVNMYATCGLLGEAEEACNKLAVRNVVTWNALIAGYCMFGSSQKALNCLDRMQTEGILPSTVTYACVLKACGCIIVTDKGQEVHTEIALKGLDSNIFVGSGLVDMYAKFGCIAEAEDVFNRLPSKNVVSWNALIAGYGEHGRCKEALKCFEQMHFEDVFPNASTYACTLKACASIQAIEKGREIHVKAVQNGFTGDVMVGTSLVDMYAKHGLLSEGKKVLDEMPVRNSVSWNALIAGYADYEPGLKALKCHEQMLLEHISPDAVTLACCLKSCASTGLTESGHELHAEILHQGLEDDLLVGTALVDMYASSAFLLEAQEVFDKMAVQSVVSWNVLIAGYAEHGSTQQSLKCFEDMKVRGISLNAITLSCALEACRKMGSLDDGQKMHSEVIIKGFERDYYVGNVLVNLYAKRGFLSDAQQVFEKLPVKTFESWTAMISGYAEHEWGSEALSCFEQMRSEGIFLDAIVFVCVLKTCGFMKALEKCQEVHIDILKRGFERDSFVGITLVDVYCKCGLLSDGHDIFNALSEQSAIAWNALIGG